MAVERRVLMVALEFATDKGPIPHDDELELIVASHLEVGDMLDVTTGLSCVSLKRIAAMRVVPGDQPDLEPLFQTFEHMGETWARVNPRGGQPKL